MNKLSSSDSFLKADRKSVTAILCDFTLAILPTFYLWNLQIRPQVKIGICCLMGFGVLQVPYLDGKKSTRF